MHYIRNEVNRLQIKMRRAMKEDRSLSEEQRKTAREAITRDEVEKGEWGRRVGGDLLLFEFIYFFE